jgi:hypothetical protein
MRQKSPPFSALGRQLAEWRRPLDEAPDLDEAVTRMLRVVDRALKGERRGQASDEDRGFSRVAAD